MVLVYLVLIPVALLFVVLSPVALVTFWHVLIFSDLISVCEDDAFYGLRGGGLEGAEIGLIIQ